MRHLPLLAVSTMLLCAALPATAQPAPGVYACYGQRGPAIPMQFGIVDGKTYSNYDGQTGSYKLVGDKLVMVSGPLKGTEYRHTASQPKDVFRLLDAKGQLTAYNCPWQKGNARRGKW